MVHFPDSTLPPVPPTTDRHEITPRAPINATHPVAGGFQEALENPLPGRGQVEEPRDEAAGPPEPERPYTGEERRLMCRRIRNIQVLLDTRSGVERRKNDQLGEAPPTHTDRTV